jgi:hypothetical protein
LCRYSVAPKKPLKVKRVDGQCESCYAAHVALSARLKVKLNPPKPRIAAAPKQPGAGTGVTPLPTPAAAAVAAAEARQSKVDSLTATVHHTFAAIFVVLCWAVMAWFALEYGTRVYDWIGPSEEPHFLATFALALIADSLVIELRGALLLFVGYELAAIEQHGGLSGRGAPTAADGWFERWLDAASLGAMRRRGGAPYAHRRAWGRGWAWLAFWANVEDNTVP